MLAKDLPTWFLVPYLLTAVGGLVAGALLDIYSSGLNLLTLGVKIERYKSVAIDGILMLIGNIYILFVAPDFFQPFQGFLITLGVLLAAWAGIFLAHAAGSTPSVMRNPWKGWKKSGATTGCRCCR